MTEGGEKDLWLLIQSNGIGGSESRFLKYANLISEDLLFRNVYLVMNEEMYVEYKKNPFTASILKKFDERKRIRIINSNRSFKWRILWLTEFLCRTLKMRVSNKAFRTIRKVFLKTSSWDFFLSENVKPNDIVHCYYGRDARNGTLLFSAKNINKVIIEITSNRLIDSVSSDFITLIEEQSILNHLYIRCVSKTVYENFALALPKDFFNNRAIDLFYYNGPLIEIKQKSKTTIKENIIIFPHRFVKPKKSLLFAEAVVELFEEGLLDNWRVLFRGKGSEEIFLKKMLYPMISNNVAEVGYSYDLFSELQKSRVAVSLIETGSYPSQSVFEAMRAGCCLLLSDSGNTKSEFNHPLITFTSNNKDNIKADLMSLIEKEKEELDFIGHEMQLYHQWFILNRNYYGDVKKLYD